MYRYELFEETLSESEVGEYITYGIRVRDEAGDVTKAVSDVSLDRTAVEALCARCTAGELEPIHLMAVIEDFL